MSQRRPSRVFGYARVSSVKQTLGSSLQDQQDALTAYATANALKMTKFFVESESGIHEKIERRVQMRELLATLRSGDLVLADKIDRWSRDPEFTYRTMRELLAKGVSVFFVGDGCDPSTPQGDTELGFRILFAREEAKRIKLRLVGTRKLLRDRGLFVEGLPPWGYRRQDVKGAERNVLVVDAAEAELVQRAFKLCIAGKAIDAIADALDVKRDRVSDALHRRLYTGQIQDAKGAWINGKHPAIVDARTYQAAQDALAGRKNGSRSPTEGVETATWWLRDVAVCGLCGAKMSAAYAGPKGPGRRHYFACAKKCTTRYVRVGVAEDACDPLVRERLVELRDELARPSVVVELAPKLDLKARRAKLEAKRERYVEMHSDGHTSREELRAQLAKLDAERMRLDAQETVKPPPAPGARREALRNVQTLTKAWARTASEARRVIANELAVSVALAAGKVPRIVWRTADELTEARG